MNQNLKRRERERDSPLGDDILGTYASLYDLPTVEYRSGRSPFVEPDGHPVVAVDIFTRDGEHVFLEDDDRCTVATDRLAEDERLIEAVDRIARATTGHTIDEVRPVAALESGTERRVVGVGFAAFVADVAPSESEAAVETTGIPDGLSDPERTLVELAEPIAEECIPVLPRDEIDSGESFFVPHLVNKHVVSRFVGRLASEKLKRSLLEVVDGEPSIILDVSAGDDEFVLTLVEEYDPELCVANDIAWKTTEILRDDDRASEVVFTNHNVLKFPVEREFDLVVFKNSLHHLPESRQLETIERLCDVADQLVVVDVSDPRRGSLRARLWNEYYVRFLGDQGNSFKTFGEFREQVETGIDGRELDFGTIETIKGEYYYCSIRRPDDTSE